MLCVFCVWFVCCCFLLCKGMLVVAVMVSMARMFVCLCCLRVLYVVVVAVLVLFVLYVCCLCAVFVVSCAANVARCGLMC